MSLSTKSVMTTAVTLQTSNDKGPNRSIGVMPCAQSVHSVSSSQQPCPYRRHPPPTVLPLTDKGRAARRAV